MKKKRRTFAEIERLAAKGGRRAKEQLRQFAELSKRSAENAASHGDHVIEDLRKRLGAFSIPEIEEMIEDMMQKGRIVGRRKDMKEKWIEILAEREFKGAPSLRSLVAEYQFDYPKVQADAFASLRRFKNRNLKKIRQLKRKLR